MIAVRGDTKVTPNTNDKLKMCQILIILHAGVIENRTGSTAELVSFEMVLRYLPMAIANTLQS